MLSPISSRGFRVSLALGGLVLLVGTAWAEPALRKWKDTSGKFEIEATLVEQTDQAVKLKKSDGSIATVPIEKLCAADRDFLKSEADKPAKPAAKPAVPPPPRPRFPATKGPPAESGASLGDKGKAITLVLGEIPKNLIYDPTPFPLAMPFGGFTASMVDAYDTITPPVVLDHASGKVAVSIGRNIINRPEETQGRIYVGSLVDGTVTTAWDVKEKLEILAHDHETDRTLVVSGIDGLSRGGDLVLLTGLAKGKAKELFRRKLPGAEEPGFAPKIDWAVLLDGEYVLAKIRHTLYAWNMITAQNLYTIECSSVGGHPIMSPGSRYLIVPTTGGAAVVNPLDGSPLGFMPGPNEHLSPAVVCHAAGKQIALAAGNEILAYDITSGEVTLDLRFCDPVSGQPLGWVADDLFVTQSGGLFRTDSPIIYWRYSLQGSAHAVAMPGGILAATTSPTCRVVALPVLTRMVEGAGNQLKQQGKQLLAMQAGSKVALAAEGIDGVGKEEVLKNLRAAVEQTDWKIANITDTTLVAVIGRAQPRQLEFTSRGIGGVPEKKETVTITAFTAKLEIRKAGKVLWSRETQNIVPPLLFLNKAETLQQAVAKLERPDTEFFVNLKLPTLIPLNEMRFGLGHSSIKDLAWDESPGPLLANSNGKPVSKIPLRPKKKP